MAEAHPVGFQWVMEAKARGAKVIHVDPRFSRTSALADLHVPIRAGADIAFVGGLINYILTNELYFRDYVLAYTNAPVIIGEEFRDADAEGIFSGFDPETVPGDRQGIALSIRQRVTQRGGSVTLKSTLGEGTEVQLSLPRTP